jgi:peptidoglycan biosynthesis protein MviN/MurJ (putative lipid II flippase)
VALSYLLSRYFGVVGLAMSASLVAALETITLILILRHRHGHFGGRTILQGSAPMALAGVIMTTAVYLLISRVVPLYASDVGFTTLAPKFLLITAVAGISYLAPCYAMRLPEANFVFTRVRDMMMRSFNLT